MNNVFWWTFPEKALALAVVAGSIEKARLELETPYKETKRYYFFRALKDENGKLKLTYLPPK